MQFLASKCFIFSLVFSFFLYAQNTGMVTFGLRTSYVTRAQKSCMAVSLSNYSSSLIINDCSFTFTLGDSLVAKLDTIILGRDMGADWIITFMRINSISAKIFVNSSSGNGLVNNSEVEFVRVLLRVSPSINVFASTSVLLSDITVNSIKVVDSDWATAGKLIVVAEPDSLGDANGNGEVEQNDALLINQCSVGASHIAAAKSCDIPFMKRADINADEQVNSLDALLVSQYVLGFLSDFPIRAASLQQKQPFLAEYSIKTPYSTIEINATMLEPKAVGPDIYEYTVNASSASGLMAANIEFSTNPDIIKDIKLVYSDVSGANYSARFNATRTTYSVSIYSNIGETRSTCVLVKIVASHKTSSISYSGFTLNKVIAYTMMKSNSRDITTKGMWVNDDIIDTMTMTSEKLVPIVCDQSCRKLKSSLNSDFVFLGNRAEFLSNSPTASLSIYNFLGRKVYHIGPLNQQKRMAIELLTFPSGRYMAVVADAYTIVYRNFTISR